MIPENRLFHFGWKYILKYYTQVLTKDLSPIKVILNINSFQFDNMNYIQTLG